MSDAAWRYATYADDDSSCYINENSVLLSESVSVHATSIIHVILVEPAVIGSTTLPYYVTVVDFERYHCEE